jgi:hypothetical protein
MSKRPSQVPSIFAFGVMNRSSLDSMNTTTCLSQLFALVWWEIRLRLSSECRDDACVISVGLIGVEGLGTNV